MDGFICGKVKVVCGATSSADASLETFSRERISSLDFLFNFILRTYDEIWR